MRIEAVIVCKDYGDFLEESLPRNLQHVDAACVVTHPGDRHTKAVCQKLGINCIETEVMHSRGDKFNKGRCINLGLSHLRHDDWLLHIDADTLLPDRFRSMLDYANLNPKCVYGADRLNVKSYEKWKEHKAKRLPQWRHGYLITPTEEFPLGSRLLHGDYGWVPIGYFQLWHSSERKKYPINQGSAEHTDVLFAIQWNRENRILLPEFFVYHLESEPTKMGTNWDGRKTKPFKREYMK